MVDNAERKDGRSGPRRVSVDTDALAFRCTRMAPPMSPRGIIGSPVQDPTGVQQMFKSVAPVARSQKLPRPR